MQISEEYVKGFNHGYLIRKNHPVLAKNLLGGATGKSEYLEGLKNGSLEYEKEWAKNLEEMKQQPRGGEKERDGSRDGNVELFAKPKEIYL